jgi:hypothetical protein
MRTLLRNAPTGLYVRAVDRWTCDPAEAFDFKTMRQAIKFAEESGFRKMELAFVSDDPDDLTTVPLAILRSRLSVRSLSDQGRLSRGATGRPLRGGSGIK